MTTFARRLTVLGATLALVLAAGAPVHAGTPGPGTIRLSSRASGLDNPVFITSANDGTGRLFIVEQPGRIKILTSGGSVLGTPFLSITTQTADGFEQGLLGLAFHPKFKTNRKLYINFTDNNGDTIIREYRTSTTNANVVATSTARTILKVAQPFDNHNGGMLAFGADGYLYIGLGDGGDSGDPGNRAQNLNSMLGKMLRIDVNGSITGRNYLIPGSNPYQNKPGLNEIWQDGLRNPWRWSFDRLTHDLWIGDVGQGKWEEIDRARWTTSGPGKGLDWGWKVLEGTHCFSPSTGCSAAGKTAPLLDFDHSNSRCAVTGGYVYRGTAIPALYGHYVFGDYCSGEIWSVSAGASAPASKTLLLDTNASISSFGENGQGELYVVDRGGTVYAVVRA